MIVPAGRDRSKYQSGRRTASTVAPRLSNVRPADCQALITSACMKPGSCLVSGIAMRMPSIEPGLVAAGEVLERLAERRRIARVGRGQGIEEQGAVLDAARHRADRIERPAQAAWCPTGRCGRT